MGYVERWRTRRKLRKLVSVLPRDLVRSYGGASFYTEPQVRSACKRLKLPQDILPFALAAYGEPNARPPEALHLRDKIARTFDLDDSELCADRIAALRIFSTWNPVEYWHSDWSHYRDSSSDTSHM